MLIAYMKTIERKRDYSKLSNEQDTEFDFEINN